MRVNYEGILSEANAMNACIGKMEQTGETLSGALGNYQRVMQDAVGKVTKEIIANIDKILEEIRNDITFSLDNLKKAQNIGVEVRTSAEDRRG